MLFISRRRVPWKQNVVVESRCVLIVGVQLHTVRCVCSKEYESTYSELRLLQREPNYLQSTVSARRTVQLPTGNYVRSKDCEITNSQLCLLQRLWY